MSLSVIIPSRTASNLIPCAKAVQEHEPFAKIVVIDDGLRVAGFPFHRVIEGKKPFIFSRAVNQGIQTTSGDVVLLNDDAILQTPGGFTEMQKLAEQHQEFGIISATTNVVGNPNQQPRGIGLREEARMVAFVCVLIPRRTIEQVGLLDERFIAYGFDDNDYCRRVREAGLKIGIADQCFVDHASLISTFRGAAYSPGDISQNAEIYRQKWGDLN